MLEWFVRWRYSLRNFETDPPRGRVCPSTGQQKSACLPPLCGQHSSVPHWRCAPIGFSGWGAFFARLGVDFADDWTPKRLFSTGGARPAYWMEIASASLGGRRSRLRARSAAWRGNHIQGTAQPRSRSSAAGQQVVKISVHAIEYLGEQLHLRQRDTCQQQFSNSIGAGEKLEHRLFACLRET